MTEHDKFFELLESYRMQFGLKLHLHTDRKGYQIEVFSGDKKVVIEHKEDEETAFHNALESLTEWIAWQLEAIDKYLSERKMA